MDDITINGNKRVKLDHQYHHHHQYHSNNHEDYEWMPHSYDSSNDITDNCLYLVNRHDSIRQLQAIHRSNFYKAHNKISTTINHQPWVIPLIDAMDGAGKSHFGSAYLPFLRNLYPLSSLPQTEDVFLQTLYKAHHIYVRGRRFDQRPDDTDGSISDSAILKLLISEFKASFKKLPAAILKNENTTTSAQFLHELTDQCGPIFIHLDGIGHFFNRRRPKEGGSPQLVPPHEQSKIFWDFCDKVLSTWFPIQNVFFLLTGQIAFSGFVKDGPPPRPHPQPNYVIERVNMEALQPSSIALLLKETFHHQKKLIEYYQIPDSELDNIAKSLFKQTHGHPRSLLHVLGACTAYQELLNGSQELPYKLYEWHQYAIPKYLEYKDVMDEFFDTIDTGSRIDLTRLVIINGEWTSYHLLTYELRLGWTGKISSAKMFASSFFIEYIRQFGLTYREYLEKIAKRYSKRLDESVVDFRLIFEWIMVKRFQSLFLEAFNPQTPQLFSRAITLSYTTQPKPKITPHGRDAMKDFIPTISPSLWGGEIGPKSNDPICYKPLPGSISPAAFFLTKDSQTGQRSYIGLVVCDENFCEEVLDNECRRFNDLCFGNRMMSTALVVLVLRDSDYLLRKMCGKVGRKSCVFKDSERYPLVDEVVIVNLASDENLREFLGVEGESVWDAVKFVKEKMAH